MIYSINIHTHTPLKYTCEYQWIRNLYLCIRKWFWTTLLESHPIWWNLAPGATCAILIILQLFFAGIVVILLDVPWLQKHCTNVSGKLPAKNLGTHAERIWNWLWHLPVHCHQHLRETLGRAAICFSCGGNGLAEWSTFKGAVDYRTSRLNGLASDILAEGLTY